MENLKSPVPTRRLSASDLGIHIAVNSGVHLDEEDRANVPEPSERLKFTILEDDAVLAKTRDLLKDGFAGVILFGPPGTSKSWYAREIAAHLVEENSARFRSIQFHPSYQYEDFVEGFAPDSEGKFHVVDKTFLDLCRIAAEDFPDEICVLVIDEFSRCDVARVFGEALTYLEMGKREQLFTLASGRKVAIPKNLVIIATMNPWDRGVDELDAALERRFAKISLDPNSQKLMEILSINKVDLELQRRIEKFFNTVKQHQNPLARIGHAYFSGVKDQQSLERLWDHQLAYHFERAFRLDKPSFDVVKQNWRNFIIQPNSSSSTEAENSSVSAAV